MIIIRENVNQYFYHPLTVPQINEMRSIQRKWKDKEKQLSLSFILLAFIPLITIALMADWLTLLIAMVCELLFYIGFKMQIPKILDTKYPCSVVISENELIHPTTDALDYVTSSQTSLFDEVPVFMQNIKRQGRSPTKFELRLIQDFQNV